MTGSALSSRPWAAHTNTAGMTALPASAVERKGQPSVRSRNKWNHYGWEALRFQTGDNSMSHFLLEWSFWNNLPVNLALSFCLHLFLSLSFSLSFFSFLHLFFSYSRVSLPSSLGLSLLHEALSHANDDSFVIAWELSEVPFLLIKSGTLQKFIRGLFELCGLFFKVENKTHKMEAENFWHWRVHLLYEAWMWTFPGCEGSLL